MTHSFDVGIAEKYGVNAAIILQHIGFWCTRSKANEAHYHDGYYWTYNTNSAMCAMFPYMTGKAIRNAIQKLVDDGIIVKGNYNEKPFDRTLWYAMTAKGEALFDGVPIEPVRESDDCQKGQIDMSKRANDNCPKGQISIAQKGRPIPNIYPNNITNINILAKKEVKQQTDDSFASFWKAYPRKVKKQDAYKLWCKLKPDDSLLQAILKDLERKKKGEWKDNEKYIPHPTTYLNQRRWEDEVDTGEEPPREIPWWELTPKEQEQRARELEERGISL